MSEPTNNTPNFQPYPPPPTSATNKTAVHCPRCGRIVTHRFCGCCGLDLAAVSPPSAQIPNGYPGRTSVPAYQRPSPGMPPSNSYAGYPAGVPFPVPSYPGYYQNPPQLPKNKKSVGKIVLLISLISVLVIALCIVLSVFLHSFFSSDAAKRPSADLFNQPAIDGYYQPEGVSEEEYFTLRKGMTYAVVSAIIGGDGALVESGQTLSGEAYYVYGWYGETKENVEVYITIINDVVTEITNKGLTE